MAGNPLTDPNWAADIADTVERVVGTVRDRATKPVVHVTRAVVFGLLGAFLGITALTLLLIALMRAIQVALDGAMSQARAVYLSYFIVGGILCLAGALVLRKRHSTD